MLTTDLDAFRRRADERIVRARERHGSLTGIRIEDTTCESGRGRKCVSGISKAFDCLSHPFAIAPTKAVMVVCAETSPVVLLVTPVTVAVVSDDVEFWAETPIASAAASANVEVSIVGIFLALVCKVLKADSRFSGCKVLLVAVLRLLRVFGLFIPPLRGVSSIESHNSATTHRSCCLPSVG